MDSPASTLHRTSERAIRPQVDLFVEVHHFGQGRAKIALSEGHQDLGGGGRRRGETTAVHLHATGHADERRGGRPLTEPAEGLDDVSGRAVAARIEHRIHLSLIHI